VNEIKFIYRDRCNPEHYFAAFAGYMLFVTAE